MKIFHIMKFPIGNWFLYLCIFCALVPSNIYAQKIDFLTDQISEQNKKEIGRKCQSAPGTSSMLGRDFYNMCLSIETCRQVLGDVACERRASILKSLSRGGKISHNVELVCMAAADFDTCLKKAGVRSTTRNTIGNSKKAFLGIRYSLSLTNKQRQRTNYFDQYGVYVGVVIKNSPAEHSDIRSGDIIVTLNGNVLRDGRHLKELLGRQQPDDKISIELFRSGKLIQKTVTLGSMSDLYKKQTYQKTYRIPESTLGVENFSSQNTPNCADASDKACYLMAFFSSLYPSLIDFSRIQFCRQGRVDSLYDLSEEISRKLNDTQDFLSAAERAFRIATGVAGHIPRGFEAIIVQIIVRGSLNEFQREFNARPEFGRIKRYVLLAYQARVLQIVTRCS